MNCETENRNIEEINKKVVSYIDIALELHSARTVNLKKIQNGADCFKKIAVRKAATVHSKINNFQYSVLRLTSN